ncbi:LodA/GoxA family CTQ-dependent oxidase [Bradyrhizobium sp. 193]|uniref:LodA/GoxA family CTQ-dependent oxidase n=1 Tax=Bradyrhizobium sp. 193 TaxID=2782661 RepID=UPI001FFA48B5|nr:LodA/GoxA family CTQ-dependent oxidase [Bradyrhizobium sp. 193]MCK1481226.1 LodA/GoxA family CTQ-dependent oxidase [Bradyrhizobium sp. 193]
MARIFKIHPSIGIARVGASKQGYFLAPEEPGGARHEVTDGGDIAFTGFKDAQHFTRRQGARFRIFEYNDDLLVGEISPDKFKIKWKVSLAASKAAGPNMISKKGSQNEKIIVPDFNAKRNPGSDPTTLTAKVAYDIAGLNQTAPAQLGTIHGRSINIGEVLTDHRGNLVVLGGFGDAWSWENSPPPLEDYLNNLTWYDDIADGPVDAVLENADGSPVAEQVIGAWVLVGPPDFAPDIAPIVSLYDVMLDAMVGSGRLARPKTSFVDDIAPILKRGAELRWTNGSSIWSTLSSFIDEPKLADPTAAGAQTRKDVYEALIGIQDAVLDGFRFTAAVQHPALTDWRDGNFIPGPDPARRKRNQAEELDHVVLSAAIGSGFFPGIEAGYVCTKPTLYGEPFRFTRRQFTDTDNQQRTPEPGFFTQRMACPWQADFTECLRNWWPAQRPDQAMFDENLSEVEELFWDRGILLGNDPERADEPGSKKNMIERVHRLGIIEQAEQAGETIFAEKGRDSQVPESA